MSRPGYPTLKNVQKGTYSREYMRALGAKGGRSTSARKAATVRRNGARCLRNQHGLFKKQP